MDHTTLHTGDVLPPSCTSQPGTALGAALSRLQQVSQALHQATEQPPMAPLTSLQNVLVALAMSAAPGRRRCPAAYVLDWHTYLLDRRHPPSPRAIRYLCWEPDVATDSRFQAYLDATMETLSSWALQGLVWCCHICWSPALAMSAITQRVQQRLAAYHGDHGLLRHWSQHAEVVLGPTGPARLAAALLAERTPISTFCRAWGLDEPSPYVLAVLHHALPACWQNMGGEPALRSYLLTTLLPWTGWSADDFRAAVGTTVLHPATSATSDMPEHLLQLVLNDARLGDPHLPAHRPNWHAVPPAARQRCAQWLAQADLRLFFDAILPECKDQEERKSFWMRYVPCILRTRPVLHEGDLARLGPLLAQSPGQLPHFGAMRGETSALLLDLGAVVVVQVSDTAKACYVYGKRNFDQLVPDFWRPQPFTVAELLVSRQGATVNYHRTWEKDVAEILALCDIRPTYKETS